ncbi:MAG: hypothetical protein U0360_01475 [Dehalococcoidia bacterium]
MGEHSWILGVVGLLAGVGAVVAWIARPVGRAVPDTLWDVPAVTRSYTTIAASLAGFAGTSVVFVARLAVDRPGAELETVVGLLIFAFLTLLATAMQLANVPNEARSDVAFRETQRYSYLLANASFTQALALEWLALLPLVRIIGAMELAGILRWVLPLAVFLAVAWLGQLIEEQTPVPRRAAVGVPVLAIVAAVLYGGLVAQWVPGLLPADLVAMRLGAVVLASVVVGYGLQTIISALHAHGHLEGAAGVLLYRAATAQAAVAATGVSLLAIGILR